MSQTSQTQYVFGDFILEPTERRLLRLGKHVRIESKAFDLLKVLIERAGNLVTKEEIFERVWPDENVEESNITYQIGEIRKALGQKKGSKEFIETVPKHGYRFCHTVKQLPILETGHTSEIHDIMRTELLSSEAMDGKSAKNHESNESTKKRHSHRSYLIPTPVAHQTRFKLVMMLVMLIVIALSVLGAFFSYKWGSADTRATSAESELKEVKTRLTRKAAQTPAVSCPGDAPDYPVFNIDPLTFRDEAPQICSDFPLIDVALDTTNPQFSTSLAQLRSIRQYKSGQQFVVLLYMHNGAANNLDPSQTTIQNVKITTSIEKASKGITAIDGIQLDGHNFYTLSAVFSGDNVESKGDSVHILLKDNEDLELIDSSGFVYSYDGRVILDMQNLNLGNSTFTLGNLDSGWEYSLFFSYKIKVVQR